MEEELLVVAEEERHKEVQHRLVVVELQCLEEVVMVLKLRILMLLRYIVAVDCLVLK